MEPVKPIKQPEWTPVVSQLQIPARPQNGIWTVAIEYVFGPIKFKISADGSWSPSEQCMSGPDGDGFDFEPTERFLSRITPRGSLIAKVGGGTSDRSGAIVPVGHFSVLDLPDASTSGAGSEGPLFLTMNDEPARFHWHSGHLIVDIWSAF